MTLKGEDDEGDSNVWTFVTSFSGVVKIMLHVKFD